MVFARVLYDSKGGSILYGGGSFLNGGGSWWPGIPYLDEEVCPINQISEFYRWDSILFSAGILQLSITAGRLYIYIKLK